MSNEAISRLKPISQRLSEAVCWLEQVKLNYRFQRHIYEGLAEVYWLLRDLKAEGEAAETRAVPPESEASNPPRRERHDSTDWIDRAAADIRDLNPYYHDFETAVADIIRNAALGEAAETRAGREE